jgi:hypothetical protein
MARKRAPGGGRKPQGEFAGKSTQLSTRITPELREALDIESDRSGWSVSQTVEWLLWRALNESERLKGLGSRHNRALGVAISLVAERLELSTGEQWRSSAYSHTALEAAIEIVLSRLAPGGEIHVPTNVRQSFEAALKAHRALKTDQRKHFKKPTKQPEALGSAIALGFLDQLETYELPRERVRRHADEFYSLPNIRYGLGLMPQMRTKK